jgi:hypothetical protein
MVWDMFPSPTTGATAIGPVSFADLQHRMGTTLDDRGRAVVTDLRIEGQPVPDLEVRVSRAVDRLRVNGILGLDFFQLFDSVLWLPRAGRITLRLP